MPILHMETDLVRGVGYQLQQASSTLHQESQQLTASVQNLIHAWQGSSATIFVGEIQPLLQQLSQFADTSAILNQHLQHEVDEWERVGAQFGTSSSLNLSDIPRFTTGSTTSWGPSMSGEDSNLWQTWTQTGESTDFLPHTNDHLIRGTELELKNRYLAGELTWEDMWRHLEEIDESLEPSYVETDFTFYKFAEGQGEIGAAIWRDDWGGENWDASLRVGSVEATGNYEFKLSEKGIEGKLQGEAGLYAVRGQYNAELAGVDVAVDGYVGAQAKGELQATFGPGVAMVTAGGSAFVGGRIDGSVSKEASIAGVKGKGEVSGGVSYGLGVKAEADVGYKDGVLKFDTDFGATVGLGAELGVSVELDVTGAVDSTVEMGKDLVGWGAKGIKGILSR